MAYNNTTFQDQIVPSLETVKDLLAKQQGPKKPTLVPLYGQISSDLITPSAAYLKVVAHTKSPYSVLFESAASEQIGRYSFVGAGPRKVLKTGEGHGEACDPIPALEKELSQHVVAEVPDLKLPPLTGGAIGYIGYDCVRQVFSSSVHRASVIDISPQVFRAQDGSAYEGCAEDPRVALPVL